MSRSYLIKRIQRNTISASLILCVAFLSVLAMAWTANAQTATFFAAKDNATEYKVFRYQVTPTTAPVLSATITDSSLIYPLGLTLGQSGE